MSYTIGLKKSQRRSLSSAPSNQLQIFKSPWNILPNAFSVSPARWARASLHFARLFKMEQWRDCQTKSHKQYFPPVHSLTWLCLANHNKFFKNKCQFRCIFIQCLGLEYCQSSFLPTLPIYTIPAWEFYFIFFFLGSIQPSNQPWGYTI